MAQVLSDLNPIFLLAVLLPLGVLITGRALQAACRVCSVKPPDFWHSVLTVVMICISNIVLRFWLGVSEVPADFGTQFVAPAVITALVIAISIRTSPLAAFNVTLVHGVLCGLIYCVANVMGKVVIAGVY